MGLIKRVSNFLNTLRKLSWIKEQVMTYQSFLVRAKGLIFLTDLISKSSKEWNFPFWIGKSKTKSRVFSALAPNLINMTIWKNKPKVLNKKKLNKKWTLKLKDTKLMTLLEKKINKYFS